MKTVSDKELLPCKCGGKGRYRYNAPTHWIECRNKRCPYQMRTRYYADGKGMIGQMDPQAISLAVNEWNRMVAEDGKIR
jgi:hypothetical protein